MAKIFAASGGAWVPVLDTADTGPPEMYVGGAYPTPTKDAAWADTSAPVSDSPGLVLADYINAAGDDMYGQLGLIAPTNINNAARWGDGIPRFASAAARDAVITAPIKGMQAYLSDLDQVHIYSGTIWYARLPTYIGTGIPYARTLSGVNQIVCSLAISAQPCAWTAVVTAMCLVNGPGTTVCEGGWWTDGSESYQRTRMQTAGSLFSMVSSYGISAPAGVSRTVDFRLNGAGTTVADGVWNRIIGIMLPA